GIGISPEMLSQVFEMFMQVDNSIERTRAGLGVGLALAKRHVELHGGTIRAESAGVGRGSEFTVRLPLLSVSPARENAGDETPGAAARSFRILLVDDNIDYATSLAALLQSQGYEVRVAHDGARALEVAEDFRPEFAFLDIGLPGMNGYDLARRLRASPRT